MPRGSLSRGSSRPEGGCDGCGYQFKMRELLRRQKHFDPKVGRWMQYGWCPKCGKKLFWYERDRENGSNRIRTSIVVDGFRDRS